MRHLAQLLGGRFRHIKHPVVKHHAIKHHMIKGRGSPAVKKDYGTIVEEYKGEGSSKKHLKPLKFKF